MKTKHTGLTAERCNEEEEDEKADEKPFQELNRELYLIESKAQASKRMSEKDRAERRSCCN